jgi:hypothetical protein
MTRNKVMFGVAWLVDLRRGLAGKLTESSESRMGSGPTKVSVEAPE